MTHPAENLELLEETQESRNQFQIIADLTSDYIYKLVFDEGGNIVVDFLTEGFGKVTGYTAFEARSPTQWKNFVYPEDFPILMKSFEATLATGVPTDLMVRLKSKAGETLWFKASAGRMLSPKTGKPIAIIGCVKDQTEQKRLEQQLIDLATFDSLTGVYNRKVLMDRLSHDVKRAKRYDKSFSLLMVDVDRFKRVNDSYGHQVGDVLLSTIGKLLRNGGRESDIVGRYGGEEFLLSLWKCPIERAGEYAERLRKQMTEIRIPVAGKRAIHATISIGVAAFPQNGRSVEDLVASADRALYRAKKLGRNQVVIADASEG